MTFNKTERLPDGGLNLGQGQGFAAPLRLSVWQAVQTQRHFYRQAETGPGHCVHDGGAVDVALADRGKEITAIVPDMYILDPINGSRTSSLLG